MKRIVVGIHEAKTTFSKLVREAEAGREIVVSNHGKPVARLVGYKPAPAPRKPGMFAGQIKISRGFDEIPEGFREAFE
ncbi:MAG: type II toxin-antitoxin system Phd/YefM family antitoxin [Actinomycetota bacterium]|nr:type II toxin-antitoxin system Phd/YefM family antitoxin [Actinomycetota bacterium]